MHFVTFSIVMATGYFGHMNQKFSSLVDKMLLCRFLSVNDYSALEPNLSKFDRCHHKLYNFI